MPWGFQASCGLRPHLSLERRSVKLEDRTWTSRRGWRGGGVATALPGRRRSALSEAGRRVKVRHCCWVD
eukprot:scaffold38361_cov49-Phaeocystis_antarctica.AAC.1